VQSLAKGPRSSVGLLSGVPLFAGLSRRDLRKVASLAEEVWMNPGKVVIEEGEPGDAFYVILDGRAKVTRRGSERTIKRLGPRDHFGELALLDGGPRTATVVAEDALDTIRIGRDSFRRLLLAEPAVGLRIMEQLVAWIRRDQPKMVG
jgi:cAMP-dependent protein kinase regulator